MTAFECFLKKTKHSQPKSQFGADIKNLIAQPKNLNWKKNSSRYYITVQLISQDVAYWPSQSQARLPDEVLLSLKTKGQKV